MWREKYHLFKHSEIVNSYLNTYSFYTIPSFKSFYKDSCKCCRNPSVDSCVDISKSTIYHYLKGIHKYLAINKELHKLLSTCECSLHRRPKEKQWLTHINGPVEDFVYLCCCPRKSYSELSCTEYTLKFIQFQ